MSGTERWRWVGRPFMPAECNRAWQTGSRVVVEMSCAARGALPFAAAPHPDGAPAYYPAQREQTFSARGDRHAWHRVQGCCSRRRLPTRPMAATDQRQLLDALHTFEHGKIVSAREAVALIRDGDTVATGGFVGIGFAENIAVALEERYVEAARDDPHGLGSPRDLTLVYAAGQGRRQGSRAEPPRPQGAGQARDRRPLGPRAQAAGTRGRQPDRGLQPSAGHHHAPVPRHRGGQARPAVARRHRHVRRSRASAAARSTNARPRTSSR